jgi:tetratricopeptide (TPR) repeat protein
MTRAAAIAIGILMSGSGAAPVQAQDAARILVMPFENVSRDGRIFWLGEASAVLLADELNAFGAAAITREERREAFERLQVPPATTLTDATVIRLGQLVGASQAIIGTLQLDGDLLVVHARTIALEAGRIQGDVTERGPIADLFATFERIARRLRPASSQPPADAPREQPSVAAFEDYIKGLLAGTPDTAVNYLTLALQLQPTFDRARLALWDIYAEQDAHDRALIAVQPVPSTSPWYRRARFLAGLSQLNLKKYDDAFATFKALVDEHPTPTALNNLGVVLLRRGGTPQTGQPAYYFNRAAEADSTDQDYFFNLGYAYWSEHDTQAAIYWLREAVRRDPADGDAHFVLGTALAAAGSAAEASREKELARRLSSTYAEWEKRPGADVVPKGLERLKSGVELPVRRQDEALTSSGQRDQRQLAQFYLERGRRLYEQESDGDALAELNRAIFLSPYLAEAHLLVGRIHLRGGHAAEAIESLKIAIWSAETAEAHAVLAEAYLALKDEASARAEVDRAVAIDPASPARRLLDQNR